MKTRFYTFFVASNDQSRILKLRVPISILHMLAVLAVVGGITVIAGVGSYSRMLWKADSYNTIRSERDTLKHQFNQLQTTVKDTNQRLDSLQSLATEVAMSYGFMQLRETPFGSCVGSSTSTVVPRWRRRRARRRQSRRSARWARACIAAHKDCSTSFFTTAPRRVVGGC